MPPSARRTPAGAARSKPSTTASSAATPPRRFDFKSIKKSAPTTPSRTNRATTTKIHKARYQSGDKQGEETGKILFVFNPRWGLNDEAKEAVKMLAYGKDDVSSFNKDLGGFYIQVHSPKQALKMHDALRALDADLPEVLDVGDIAEPQITIVTVNHLNVPETKAKPESTNVTALMLQGYSFPLYKHLRELDYDFVRGVHGHAGVNAWVRVVEASESVAALEAAAKAMLAEEGWSVDVAVGDAAEWDSE